VEGVADLVLRHLRGVALEHAAYALGRADAAVAAAVGAAGVLVDRAVAVVVIAVAGLGGRSDLSEALAELAGAIARADVDARLADAVEGRVVAGDLVALLAEAVDVSVTVVVLAVAGLRLRPGAVALAPLAGVADLLAGLAVADVGAAVAHQAIVDLA